MPAASGGEGELGVLTPGAVGDVAVWPLVGPAFAGALADPVEAWLRCGPVSARHTVVDGRPVVRDGVLVSDRLAEMLTAHTRLATSNPAPVTPVRRRGVTPLDAGALARMVG